MVSEKMLLRFRQAVLVARLEFIHPSVQKIFR